MAGNIVAVNRKARAEYTVLETVEAGLVLQGTEVKSLRDHRATLQDSFARVERRGAYLYNLHISPYAYGHQDNHDPRRTRKLLLHKAQLRDLRGRTTQKGLTLIPLKIYFRRGVAKIELAVARGKRHYDRREELKRREHDLEMRRAVRRRR